MIETIIKQIFNDLLNKENLDKELIKDTNIYYCNGKNGTEFEYFCNKSSAPFCLYYTDGYCAIKLFIIDKQFNIYLYNHRNILIPFRTLEFDTNIRLNKIYKYLNKKYDSEGLFDSKI